MKYIKVVELLLCVERDVAQHSRTENMNYI